MSVRRLPAILAAVAGAAVLAAAGAWFLRTGEPLPADGGAAGTGEGISAGTGGTASSPETGTAPPIVVRAPEAKPYARLRLVDEATRLPVPFGRGCAAVLILEGDGRKHFAPLPLLRVDDGRWILGWPYGKDNDPRKLFPKAVTDAAQIEVRAPGYERFRLAASRDLEEDAERLLRPAVPSVRGEFVGGPAVLAESFLCDLHPRAGEGPAPVFGEDGPPLLPNRLGPFRIFELPPGRWRLEARASVGGTEAVRAVRDFEKGEGTVDLGEIRLLAPVTIRARVVGRDGTGVLDSGIEIHDADAEGFERPANNPMDKDGWVEFTGLEPGVEYRIKTKFEGVERVVHAPAEGGKVVTVEMSSEIRGVRCRLRFTVNGQDPVKWGEIVEGPTLDEGAWKRDGTLEQEMAAGEYGFIISAQPIGKDGMRKCRAVFTVPEGADWEKTIDLREGE